MKKLKTGIKYDQDKIRWDLLPWEELEEMVKVLMHGSKKYEDDNWKRVSNKENRYFAALIRHLKAWKIGEEKDNESNLSHLAHAGCCILFLMWNDNQKKKGKLYSSGHFIKPVLDHPSSQYGRGEEAKMKINWNNVLNLPFSLACKFVRRKIKKDKGLYDTYKSNLAMAFYDEIRRERQGISNEKILQNDVLLAISGQAAEKFLNLWMK